MRKKAISIRFIASIFTIVVIAIAAAMAIFLAKGYRFSTQKGTFTGTGIMSITSIPDQASVYLDGHLTTATNANINSLVPKKYEVKIVKEGFIAWQKELEVREGLVSEIKATLYPAIPTIYPLTYNGVMNPILSPDGEKLVFVVPGTDKKSGLWVWTMSQQPIAFARGSEPHQIALASSTIDFSKAKMLFSPDSSQVLAQFPEQSLLLDLNKLNETPKDVTPILQPTLSNWQDETQSKRKVQIQAIKDINLRKTASDSANLAWSPDETKFLISDKKANDVANLDPDKRQKINYTVVDLTEKKTYKLPPSLSATWLADSRHLVLVDRDDSASSNMISVVEYDGFNQAILYAGNFNLDSVYPWPDGSRLIFVTSFPTPTALQPNLYGITIK